MGFNSGFKGLIYSDLAFGHKNVANRDFDCKNSALLVLFWSFLEEAAVAIN